MLSSVPLWMSTSMAASGRFASMSPSTTKNMGALTLIFSSRAETSPHATSETASAMIKSVSTPRSLPPPSQLAHGSRRR